MEKEINLRKINIKYLYNTSNDEIQNLSMIYDFHEIILSDLFEKNIQDKIDTYDDLLFIVCHIPKYDKNLWKYFSNEFKIIVWKSFVIIISDVYSKKIAKLLQEIQNIEVENDEKYKLSPYYVVYRFWDIMLDKVFKHMHKFNKDILDIEEEIYDGKFTKEVLSKIVLKKKNISFVKNIMDQHEELLEELQSATITFFKWELDVYFEDLITKLDKLDSNILMSAKNTNSLMDTYNWLMNIQTNMTIKVLTIFTVFLWIANSVSSIYGMNISLPFEYSPFAFLIVILIMLFLMLTIYAAFKIKDIF